MTIGTTAVTTIAIVVATIPAPHGEMTAEMIEDMITETEVGLVIGPTGATGAVPDSGRRGTTIGGIEAAPAAVILAIAVGHRAQGPNDGIVLALACDTAAEIEPVRDPGTVIIVIGESEVVLGLAAIETAAGTATARKTGPRRTIESDDAGAAPGRPAPLPA